MSFSDTDISGSLEPPPQKAADDDSAVLERLVAEAAEGRRESFSHIVRLMSGKMLGFFYARIHNMSEAEDLTQETFLLAWKNIRQYQQRGTFAGWLFTIAINQLRTRLRRKHPYQPLNDFLPSSNADSHQQTDSDDSAAYFWGVVRQHLSHDQYTAILLHYRSSLSTEEIARAMRKSQANVKVLLHRGRLKLHQRLSESPQFQQAAAVQRNSGLKTFVV